VYSFNEGTYFNNSLGGGQAMYVGSMGSDPLAFGAVGFYFKAQGSYSGIAVSEDGGKFWKTMPIAGLTSEAQYGYFASKTQWWVSAGTAPQASQTTRRMRSRWALPELQSKDGQQNLDDDLFPDDDGTTAGPLVGNYSAQFMKTTDGGQTWTTLFSQNNTFEFGEMSCSPSNPDHCCVTGGAAQPLYDGALIMCTFDGNTVNTTWQKMATTTEAYDIGSIVFVDDKTVYAAGGVDGKLGIVKGYVLKSTDGGKTWAEQDTTGLIGIVFNLNHVGGVIYGTIINTITQMSSVIKYTAL
jgi:photosystem II stability/assembly factor-like uncharacterized protein